MTVLYAIFVPREGTPAWKAIDRQYLLVGFPATEETEVVVMHLAKQAGVAGMRGALTGLVGILGRGGRVERRAAPAVDLLEVGHVSADGKLLEIHPEGFPALSNWLRT